jgi:hypothetical protein
MLKEMVTEECREKMHINTTKNPNPSHMVTPVQEKGIIKADIMIVWIYRRMKSTTMRNSFYPMNSFPQNNN